jgi:hypothetical protein
VKVFRIFDSPHVRIYLTHISFSRAAFKEVILEQKKHQVVSRRTLDILKGGKTECPKKNNRFLAAS